MKDPVAQISEDRPVLRASEVDVTPVHVKGACGAEKVVWMVANFEGEVHDAMDPTQSYTPSTIGENLRDLLPGWPQ